MEVKYPSVTRADNLCSPQGRNDSIMQETNHGHDLWQQRVNQDLADLRREGFRLNERMDDLDERQDKTESRQTTITYRLAMILGGVIGLAATVGFVLGSIFPWLSK